MQQTVSRFDPLHAAHAIEQVVVSVSYATPVPDATLNALIERAAGFGDKLPGTVPIEPAISFSLGPGGAVQVNNPGQGLTRAGIARQRLRADGAIEAQVRVARNELAFITTAYTRWGEIFPSVMLYFSALLPIYISASQVSAFTVQYLDRFLWKGELAGMRADVLLRRESKYVAPMIFEADQNFHCHTGAFIKGRPYSRRLVNVNIDANEATNPVNQLQRSVSILTLLRDQFYIEGFENIDLKADTLSKLFQSHADELHTMSKQLLADVLLTGMARRIQLDAS